MMFKVVFFVSLLLTICTCNDDSNEFYEVDVRKVLKNSQIKFGTRIYNDFTNSYREMIKSIGSVYELAYWATVWEVSAAAPAPHEADDERMDRWIGSVYWNIASEIETMKNTSRLMNDEGVSIIGASTSPPNSYYNTPQKILQFRKRKEAEKEGRVLEEEEWSLEKEMQDKAKEDPKQQYNRFMPESSADFAKFWASSIEYLRKHNLTLPLLELTWEPNNKDFVYIFPVVYALIVNQTRQEFNHRGIPEEESKIIGPGTSTPLAAKPYIDVFAKHREVYDALSAWSVHIVDNGQSLEQIEKEILGFKQLIKARIPRTWPAKPVIVTSFGYRPDNNFAFGDITYNGDMDNCYYKIMGRFRKDDDNLPNSMSQSPTTGVRLLASLIIQFTYGFTQTVYEELADVPWSHSCKGMFDRSHRKKQIFVAFSTLLPHIAKGSKVVKKQWTHKDECFIAMIKSSSRFIVALANPSSKPCSRSFSLSGLPTSRVTEAFSLSYNNGTVSLDAAEAAEALVLTHPLNYDVFPSDNPTDGKVLEFDIVIGPNASATAVINFGDKQTTKQASSENGRGENVVHSEL